MTLGGTLRGNVGHQMLTSHLIRCQIIPSICLQVVELILQSLMLSFGMLCFEISTVII
jgi:hypothetical protein